MTKLAAKLPDEFDNNGLDAIFGRLTRYPEESHLVVAVIDVSKLTTDVDTGMVEPTVRITAIEPILDEEKAALVRGALIAARRHRTGQETLDLVTGELTEGAA